MSVKSKKILIIISAIVFIMALIGCFMLLFTVKKIDVVYSSSEFIDGEKIQKKLDGFKDNILLFLDEDTVKESIKTETYAKIVKIEKKFPNSLLIEIEERKEVYLVKFDDKTVITDEEGFILREGSLDDENNRLISLNFKGVSVLKFGVGEKLKTDRDNLYRSTLKIAKSVGLYDCIKAITVGEEKETSSGGIAFLDDILVDTYTGVSIYVSKANENGEEKIEEAFKAYEQETNDYQKFYSSMRVYKEDSGKISVIWNERP